jgi:UDP-N-acetylmuramoyl-tripeptide--D-alanyl-D-alanine ligase
MSERLFGLQQAAQWIDAKVVGDPQAWVSRVHTDSRTVQAGDLFVAIKGENFDGHDFLKQIRDKGVTLAMAEHGLEEAGLQGLQVSDTRLALGRLARGWRLSMPLRQLIAVTGSNGKTTVTQMLASILRAHAGEAALSTQGNFNNDIGVPLTLLRLREQHFCAVLELGMNHPGEIAHLADWAQPTVALVNNAQREHQEFMQSVRAVALENGAVLQALSATGAAVFPADDEHTALWREIAGTRRTLTFGEKGDVRLLQSQASPLGWRAVLGGPALQVECMVELSMPGEHNLRNAMAATACALAADIPVQAIVQGLSVFRPVAGRSHAMALRVHGKNLTLVDDTYNANPDSVRAAIDVLAQMPSPQLLILGDMGEVGTQGPEFHAEVGRYAKDRGIRHVLTLGELAAMTAQAHGQAHHHDQVDALCHEAIELLDEVGSVLVKGSRFMKMERVVQRLQQTQENAAC